MSVALHPDESVHAADEEFNLRATIRDVLASSAKVDPHDVATEVIDLLPTAVTDELVYHAVVGLVSEEVRLGRKIPARAGQSRWARHGIFIEGLGDRIYVAGRWESLADCTASMLDIYASEQIERAKAVRAAAKRASALAAELRAAGVETVADLVASRNGGSA